LKQVTLDLSQSISFINVHLPYVFRTLANELRS